MEPPADASALLPQASTGDPLPVPTHGSPAAITGGTGFNDAPRLTGGATYQDTIATGGSRFYRVPLQWGQRLSYLVTEVGPAQPPLGITGSPVRVKLFNPVRLDITETAGRNSELWFADEPAEPINGDTAYPVRYTNREGTEQRGFALDGDYYLQVNANRNDDEPTATTFLVTVVISGAVEPGPIYQQAGAGGAGSAINQSSTPSTASSATASAPVMTSAPRSSTSTAATTSSGSDPATTPTGQASPITGTGMPGWVWALVGFLAAAAVAGLLFVLSRRRASSLPGSQDGQPGSRH